MKAEMNAASEIDTQDMLEALTAEDRLASDADAAPDPNGWGALIRALQRALPPVAPRREFRQALRRELLADERDAGGRRRQLPARVSFAALLALAAGCLVIMLRRIFDSQAADIADMQEEAVASSA